jgi:hypothetical protein
MLALGLRPDVAAAQRGARCVVTEVRIAPADPEVRVGQTVTFLADGFDRNGSICPAATFTWSSNNQAVARVDASGIASGIAPGTAIVTAITGTGAARRTGQATIQVVSAGPTPVREAAPLEAETTRIANRPIGPGCAAWERQPEGSGTPAALTVNPLRALLVRGEMVPLRFTAVKDDNTPSQRVCIVFEVDPTGERIASVDSFGVVRAGADTGQTVVRAAVQGRFSVPARTIRVEVRGDSIRFREAAVSLSPGGTDTLEIEVPAQDRVLNPVGMFQFSSSDPSIVRVGAVRPIIEALAPGRALITAESDVYQPMAVTVNVHRPVRFLRATPADSVITIAIGSTRALTAQALADDSAVVAEAPLRWQAPDSAVVQWDSAAHTMRGLRIGETRVAVAAPAGRDSTHTKVWRIRVVAGGLAATRSRVGLGVGERTPIRVRLLDDRRQPIEDAATLTWRSSDSSVARYENGQIAGLRAGRARITAVAPWESTTTVEAFVVGNLIVSALRQGRWDLYSAGAAGLGAALTSDSMVEVDNVAWSPDLTRLAWVASPGPRGTTFELYVANADGSEPRRLTADSAEARSPAFVPPAGDQIVFQSTRGGRPQIYSIGRDGTGLRALASGDFQNYTPSPSPDGRKVVYMSLRQISPGLNSYGVYEIGLDGAGERLLASMRRGSAPSYSADGSLVYFLRDEGSGTQRLIELNPATNAERALTPPGVYVRSYSMSHDRATIALAVEERQGDRSVTRVKLLNVASGQLADFPAVAGELVASPSYRPATPQPR